MTTTQDGQVPNGPGGAQAIDADLPGVASARASVEKAQCLLREVPDRPQALDEARAAIQEALDSIPA